MIEGFLVAIGIYLAGWALAALCFFRIQGPVPVPGRFRRDARDALLWPVWLMLFAVLWLIELRRQEFEKELTGD
ncbi:hypothetical protein SAMN05518801_102321 [Novosphingobium sp. CF614]|uniref:hypothetical protein n=1 Tax=Novosphingobium sp. CF614 TaxID=1884364 RepID=UPI0008E6BE3D|nr:hypothetical protein [Novosphingobium sp. CF614]SFF86822.1 hypothetical protein SAMN05518801_102321 [Novosphingobium sp. CF614]